MKAVTFRKNVWTDERTQRIMGEVGERCKDLSNKIGESAENAEELERTIEDNLAWLEIMSWITTRHQEYALHEFRENVKNIFRDFFRKEKNK